MEAKEFTLDKATKRVLVKATELADLRRGLTFVEVEIKPEPKKKYMVYLRDKNHSIIKTNKLTKTVVKVIDGVEVEFKVPRFRKEAIIVAL